MNPGERAPLRADAAEIRATYEGLAAIYDWVEAVPEYLVVRWWRRRLLGRARGRVLEVAAGTGRNLPHYPDGRVRRVVATDLTRAMLERARPRARKTPARVSLGLADASELPVSTASFDTVVSTLTTCTFPDPVAAVREMARACRAGGEILLLEHGRSAWGWLARWQDRHADAHFERFRCRWDQEPVEWLEEAGVPIVEHERGVAGVLHRIVAAPHGTEEGRTR